MVHPEGNTSDVSVPASEGVLNVTLVITSEDLCSKTLNHEILISTSPFASQPDLNSCFGEEVEILPENGTYFGFYEDAELTSLIKKGTRLKTSTYSQLYVVNLDDGLPGMPIEVNISDQSYSLDIIHLTSRVGQKNKVELSIESNDDLTNHMWYVNGQLSETIVEPIFFFDDELYEIVVTVSGTSGCERSDTVTLNFTPPLSLDNDEDFNIYPNPSGGIVTLESVARIEEINLFSLDGRMILNLKDPKREVDLTELRKGLYILEARVGNNVYKKQLILK